MIDFAAFQCITWSLLTLATVFGVCDRLLDAKISGYQRERVALLLISALVLVALFVIYPGPGMALARAIAG